MTSPATKTTPATWKIDPAHSSAEFKVRHMMISWVKGRFTAIEGVMTLDEDNIANSRVEATVQAASIDTREAQRDAHLKSADFFDVEKFPALSFKSTRVAPVHGGNLKVEGELAIHGVSRPVVFAVEGPTAPAKDPWGNTRVGLTATTKINRRDFGLTWNAALEAGGILVGEEVTITLDVEFVKA